MTTPTNSAAPIAWIKKLAPKTQKTILVAIAALVIIIGGGFAYNYFVVKPADEKAQTQLSTALDMLNEAQQIVMQNAQVQAMPDSALSQALVQQGVIQAQSPDSIALQVTAFRADQKKQAANAYAKVLKGDGKFPGLLKLAKGSGTGANMATYLAGVAYYHQGQYKDAIKYLKDYSTKGDKGLSPMVLSALANSYACDGQVDKAISTFKKAASEADNEVLTPYFLIEAGKLLENQNKKADAHKLYEQVKKDYPQYGTTQSGMASSEVDKYIERTK